MKFRKSNNSRSGRIVAILSINETGCLCNSQWVASSTTLTIISGRTVIPSFAAGQHLPVVSAVCSSQKQALRSCMRRHDMYTFTSSMMTSSNGNIFRVTDLLCGEFTGHLWIPAQKSVTWSFGVFFHLRLNKRLSKQSWGWWFERPSRSLWRNCYEWPFVGGTHKSTATPNQKRPIIEKFGIFIVINLNDFLNNKLSCWWFQRHDICVTLL